MRVSFQSLSQPIISSSFAKNRCETYFYDNILMSHEKWYSACLYRSHLHKVEGVHDVEAAAL
jgi:hypothetical protein